MEIEKVLIGKDASVSIQKDTLVSEGLKVLQEHRVRKLVVLDGERFVGFFSLKGIIRHLLPKALTLQEEIPDMEFIHGDEADVIERLGALGEKILSDVVTEPPVFVTNETDLTETLRHLYVHDSPLPVVDKLSRKFLGLVTAQSMLEYLSARM